MKIAVLASGRGSNFEAIARALKSGKINGEIAVLIVDRKNIGAIEKAEMFGIDWIYVDADSHPSREDYDRKIVSILKYLQVDLGGTISNNDNTLGTPGTTATNLSHEEII